MSRHAVLSILVLLPMPALAQPSPEKTGEESAAPERPQVADAPDTELRRSADEAEPAAEPEPETPELSDIDAELLEQGLAAGETILIKGDTVVEPGSAHSVDAEELERHEYDDVHRVLGSIPGVYMREEDGYGLRPNIGMRGSSSERSAKIALMEDGVLIAPAPYSAPAAYFFPLVTRMERVEVVKGSASVRHGPNTVGGAVNLISTPIPAERTAEIDTALGGDLYGKVHGGVGDSYRHGGFWVEGVTLHSNGFKDLDGGGETGFDKNEIVAKGRLNSAPDRPVYHQLELKVGFANEDSNETYTGLSQADFDVTPNRRYAGTALDRMDWEHLQLKASHRLEVGDAFDVTTTVYRHTFDRSWRKLNGFNTDRSLATILANPESGNNAVFYSVLTGQADSTSDAELLLIGTNDRQFVSQGIQAVGHTRRRAFGLDHELSVGARLHLDEARRRHSETPYAMRDGVLASAAMPERTNEDSLGSARAWALFAQDAATIGPVTVTAGVRAELVSTRWQDELDPSRDGNDFFSVLVPGVGALYRFTDHLGALAGVHKGFVPVAPGQDPEVRPEESWNYEAGLRYADSRLRGEVIGFFNDYENLKGSCSFSAGCSGDMVTDEFNGGRVHSMGLESLAAADLEVASQLWLPLKASYTFTRSRFQTSFSSHNPQWGSVEAGDELPYLPRHRLSLSAGVRGSSWEVAAAGRYVGTMRDSAGSGSADELDRIDGHAVLDLAAHVGFGEWGELYGTVDNLFDQAYIVSRRPIGARPGKPRMVIIGYKNRF